MAVKNHNIYYSKITDTPVILNTSRCSTCTVNSPIKKIYVTRNWLVNTVILQSSLCGHNFSLIKFTVQMKYLLIYSVITVLVDLCGKYFSLLITNLKFLLCIKNWHSRFLYWTDIFKYCITLTLLAVKTKLSIYKQLWS